MEDQPFPLKNAKARFIIIVWHARRSFASLRMTAVTAVTHVPTLTIVKWHAILNG